MFNPYFASRFPEDLYTVAQNAQEDYSARVIYGFERMKDTSITIGILARNLEHILPYTIVRINALRTLFRSVTLVAYENDSTDKTKEILSRNVEFLISEELNNPVNKSDKSEDRKVRMAYYRNRLKDRMMRYDSDYYMIYDADILGGFSYEGIANSFSYTWDVCGSNSIMYDTHENKTRRVYYDSWAWRSLGVLTDTQEDNEKANLMFYHRGDRPVRVTSCFGGLALYNKDTFQNVKYKYESYDCDHPTLHIPMWKDGKTIVMNPSQIVLYNKTRYVS
jgi:hypothetical protein